MQKFLSLFLIIFLTGCFKTTPPVTNLSDAHKKFIELTEKETGIKPLLKEVGNTLWIYLPTKKNIIKITAAAQNAPVTNQATESLSVRYVDAYFKENAFHIEYDIGMDKKYGQKFGYSSTYSDEYQSWQRVILYNLQNAYGDIENVPGDVSFVDAQKDATHKELVNAYVKTADAPDFFVFVVADTVNGIEAQTTIYEKDISKILSPMIQLPMEESSTRYIMKLQGDQAIINDEEGKHLEYTAMTLNDFLAQQMVNRINFRYTRSSFSPTSNTMDELLMCAAKTIHYYAFEDFTAIVLHNLDTEATSTFTKEDLQPYIRQIKEEKPPKYQVIKFNANNP